MADISVEDVLYGYCNGVFPMADEETNQIFWYSPNPRAIIPISTYKCHKSLRPVLNKKIFEIKINTDFESVIRNCALPRFEGDSAWISEKIIEIYCQLHQLGYAHTVEAWYDGKLAGGLYGVAIGSVFFGESMFYQVPNASKVAFHFLIEILRKNQFVLLDTQFMNENVKRYGAVEISKNKFMKLLEEGLGKPNIFKF